VHTVGGPPAEPDLNGADAVRGATTSSPGSRSPGNAFAAWAATREGSSPPLWMAGPAERRGFGDASATRPPSTLRGVAGADPGEEFGTAPAPVRTRGASARIESFRCRGTVGVRSPPRSTKNAGGFVQESTPSVVVFIW